MANGEPGNTQIVVLTSEPEPGVAPEKISVKRPESLVALEQEHRQIALCSRC
jgi:hypothetical protein